MNKHIASNNGKALSEIAYSSLRASILNQDILVGSPIQETEVAKSLNVSRTPVRAAIDRLVSEGLLKRIPNRGVIVTPIDVKEVHDVFELRDLLEIRALEKSFDRVDRHKLTRYEQKLRKCPTKDTEKILAIDEDIHLLIAKAAGNAWLENSIKQLLNISLIMRVVSTIGTGEATIQELSSLLEAWLSNDLISARLCLKQHIESSKTDVLQRKEPHEN